MEYILQPNITKEFLLNKIPEEQLMEHYLGVPVKKGLFKSPIRTDRHSTCAYYRNKNGRLIFKDFSGAFIGDVFAVVMYIYSCGFTKALSIIANDFGIIKRPDLKINKPKLKYTGTIFKETEDAIIQVEIRSFQKYELNWWASFGISKKTLEKFKVFSCKNVFLNNNLFHIEKNHQLVFGYYGGITTSNIENWRIYFPGKKYKFISNWKSYKLQGAHMLPKDGGDVLCITKSMKDVMVLYEYGISAIAPISENLFLTEKQYLRCKQKFKHLFVFYDNDKPGLRNLAKIRRKYDVIITFIPKKYNVKDISDFRKQYGHEKTLELINQAKSYYLNEKKD